MEAKLLVPGSREGRLLEDGGLRNNNIVLYDYVRQVNYWVYKAILLLMNMYYEYL